MNEPQKLAHKKVLIARRIEHFTRSVQFENAWQNATNLQREDMLFAIKNCNETVLRTIFKIIPRNLETLTYEELKERAKNHHVPKWSRLEKEELITALKERGLV